MTRPSLSAAAATRQTWTQKQLSHHLLVYQHDFSIAREVLIRHEAPDDPGQNGIQPLNCTQICAVRTSLFYYSDYNGEHILESNMNWSNIKWSAFNVQPQPQRRAIPYNYNPFMLGFWVFTFHLIYCLALAANRRLLIWIDIVFMLKDNSFQCMFGCIGMDHIWYVWLRMCQHKRFHHSRC